MSRQPPEKAGRDSRSLTPPRPAFLSLSRAGWTEGVLKMREGERARLHVPSKKGYGAQEVGQKGAKGGFYIPPNADLLFDIEVLGKN